METVKLEDVKDDDRCQWQYVDGFIDSASTGKELKEFWECCNIIHAWITRGSEIISIELPKR